MLASYHSFDDISHLKTDWNRLADLKKNPLSSFEWYAAAARAFHTRDKLYIFCVFDDDRLVAAAPLYRSSNFFDRYRLQLIGSSALYEPTSLLYETAAALTTLAQSIINSGYPVMLSRLVLDTEAGNSLSSIACMQTTLRAADSQYIAINSDFEQFETTLSAKRRSDLRRAVNRATRIGALTFDIQIVDPDTLQNRLQTFYQIEDANWKGRKNSSILCNPAMRNFIDTFTSAASQGGNLVIGFMNIEGTPVAGNLSIHGYDTIWTLKIGYDAAYGHASPGILLTHEMIRFAHDLKAVRFEFMGSSEQWINLWRPERRHYETLLCYPYSIRGLCGMAADFCKRILNKLSAVVALHEKH